MNNKIKEKCLMNISLEDTDSVIQRSKPKQNIIRKLINIFSRKKRVKPLNIISEKVSVSEKMKNINDQIRLFYHSIRGPINNTLLGISLLQDIIEDNNTTKEIIKIYIIRLYLPVKHLINILVLKTY